MMNQLATLLRPMSVALILVCSFSYSALGQGQESSENASPSKPQQPSGQLRPAKDRQSLRRWLENMVWHHRFTREEVLEVTGLDLPSLNAALQEFNITPENRPEPEVATPLFVIPYPGGRHPRIGFLDGAIEPQRETKLSIFAPWDHASYTVLDAPEAIWSNLGLAYLAHTHVDTLWTKQGIDLPKLEWETLSDGSLRQSRQLPNKIAFDVVATPQRDHLSIRMSLTNGTRAELSDLRVQVCAMLKAMKGFEEQTNDNKVFRGAFAACRNAAGDRWVVLGFQKNHRTWGNPPCPCLHSDPIFDPCPPGETRWVHGWFSFYQGTDIQSELDRIEAIWRPFDRS